MPATMPKAKSTKARQRSHALNAFNETIRQADAKSIKLLDLLNEQTQYQLEFAFRLHKILVIASLIVLVISIFIVFISTSNQYLQIFSLIGTPVSLLTLLITYLRNPISKQYQTIEEIFKLNVIFLSFIHRVQNADLLLEHTITEDNRADLAKLFALIKDFENIEDEVLEKIKEI